MGKVILALFVLCAFSLAQGYKLTSKDNKLWINGQRFHAKGLSWSGIETPHRIPGGLSEVSADFLLGTLHQEGFNLIRMPLSLYTVLQDPPVNPGGIDLSQSPMFSDARTILEVLDKIIELADHYGILILLDMHKLTEWGNKPAFWYDSQYGEEDLKRGYQVLIDRYGKVPNVIGIDLFNEPHGAEWGTGNMATDWHLAAERLGNYIIENHPSWIAAVEGVGGSDSQGRGIFWGANFMGARSNPVVLKDNTRLVYSPHTYGPSVYEQGYFFDGNFPDNMPAIWDEHFGLLVEVTDQAVMMGEWGGFNVGKDALWQSKFVDYLISKDMADSLYWAINPTSEDTGGFFQHDWRTIVESKSTLLKRLQPNPTKIKTVGTVAEESESVENSSGSPNGNPVGVPLHSPKASPGKISPTSEGYEESNTATIILAVAIGIVAVTLAAILIYKKYQDGREVQGNKLRKLRGLLVSEAEEEDELLAGKRDRIMDTRGSRFRPLTLKTLDTV